MDNNSTALNIFRSLPSELKQMLIAEDKGPVAYSVDEVVSSFLREHDVFVTPVGSSISASPLTSGLMGGLGGPMAVGMNQALTAQTKGAALQEWTSWKQWALSHPDFKEYKQKAEARAEKCNSEFIAWYDSQEAKDKIASLELAAKKENQVLFCTVVIVLSITFFGLLLSGEITSRFFPPVPEEPVPERLQ